MLVSVFKKAPRVTTNNCFMILEDPTTCLYYKGRARVLLLQIELILLYMLDIFIYIHNHVCECIYYYGMQLVVLAHGSPS